MYKEGIDKTVNAYERGFITKEIQSLSQIHYNCYEKLSGQIQRGN